MWASAEGHADVVAWLIEAGADFRSPLKSGFTPLFFAIREGRHEVVQTLIEAGIDIHEAMDPERRASRGPQSGMTPLLMAVENGHFELAIELVKAGADPDDLRPGYAALHAITWVRKPDSGEGVNGLPPPDGSGNLTSLEFVKNMLSLGADVNIRIPNGHGGAGKFSRQGATPFLMAAKTADLNLLKLLHQSGADPTHLERGRSHPPHCCCRFRHGRSR
jgi:ankyrin repeat protein